MNSIRAAVIVALAVAGVTCNDLQLGSNHGRIVFNETIQASPAIWRQSQQITINVTDQEIISGVVVTDQRAEKDGEAKIIEGGEGQQNVTVELKSPTVFRGFDFHVTVYAAQGSDLRPFLNDAQHPAVISKDTDLNIPALPENKDSVNIPKVTEESAGTTLPAEDLPRKYRNTEHPDPIVKFVTEKNDVNQRSTEKATELTTEAALKVNGPIAPAIFLGELPTDNTAQTNGPVPTPVPKDFDVKVTSTGVPSTTEVPTTGVPDTTTTEKTHEKMVLQNFDSISQELGQKVVFGIKKH